MRTPSTNPALGRFRLAPLAAAVAAAALPAQAAPYDVTNVNDSGPGSLRDVISQVTAFGVCATDPSPVIRFAIPSGPFTIALASNLPPLMCGNAVPFNPVIDGTFQSGYTPNTAPSGFNSNIPIILDGTAVTGGCGIESQVSLSYGGATTRVQGLRIRNFSTGAICGRNFTAYGNILEMSGQGAFNYGGTINQVTVGGAAPAQRNVIRQNSGNGIHVSAGGASTITNNFIGTDTTGNAAAANSGDGINIIASGSSIIQGNVISGNAGNGIYLQSETGVSVIQNKIGVGSAGASIGNGGAGVGLVFSNNVNIFNNSIAGNGGRGINLDFYGGPLLNDYQDVDTGSNGWQNNPEIQTVHHVGGNTEVTYYFNSTPGQSYTIDFYSNATPGVYEGKTYITSNPVSTDAAGDAGSLGTVVTTLPGLLDNISAVARFSGNATSEFSQAVAFTTVAAVNVVPSMIDFGNVGTGTTSPSRGVSLTSTGDANWIISGIGTPSCYGGPICYGGGDFLCSTTCTTFGPGYANGTGCSVTASFAPTTLGPQSTTIEFCSNTTSGSNIILLTGNGVVPPDLSLLPSFYDFGMVGVNTTSPAATFAIRNSGTLPVSVVAYRTSGPYVFEDTSCGNPVMPGESCQARVTFRPTAAGSAPGTFVIEPATGNRAVSNLAGTGSTAPRLALPSSIEFAYTLGSEPTLFPLTLSNSGLGDLQLNSISISGAPFTLQNPCPATLAPGESCVLILGFATSTAGQFNGTLTVATNAPGGSRAITLTGIAQLKPVPVLEVTPSTMGYGSRAFGVVSPDQTVTIRNIGGAPARIDTLITSADFVVLNHNCTTLAPLASCEADIAMRATAYGQRRGTLTITSNADKSPHSVVLIGTSCRTSGLVLGRQGLTSGCAP